MQARDWPRAIALYESLRRRIGNNDATILNNLAWAYSESGDYRRALPLAERAFAPHRDAALGLTLGDVANDDLDESDTPPGRQGDEP